MEAHFSFEIEDFEDFVSKLPVFASEDISIARITALVTKVVIVMQNLGSAQVCGFDNAIYGRQQIRVDFSQLRYDLPSPEKTFAYQSRPPSTSSRLREQRVGAW